MGQHLLPLLPLKFPLVFAVFPPSLISPPAYPHCRTTFLCFSLQGYLDLCFSTSSHFTQITPRLGSPALSFISCIHLRFPDLMQSIPVPVCYFQTQCRWCKVKSD